MTQDVSDALAANFERYEIREQLHDVPPHAVCEVRVDGRRAVCKVARGDTADPGTEAAVIDHVDRHTDLPVPSVLAAGDGYFVASWLDGVPGEDEAPDPDEIGASYARALGTVLARLHDATAGAFVRPGFPRAGGGDGDPLRVDARDRWVAVVRERLDEVAAYLADTEWVDPVQAVRALVEDYPGLFAGAGDPVLCHGNVLPDHIGFTADASGGPADLAALVDFEHALVAPGEYDFWRTAIPLFGRPDAASPRHTLSTFRAGYESVRPLPDGFERRRDGYRLLNLASYFVALDVQNGEIGPDERPQANGMAEAVSETVESVRGRRR
ncbi:phosphotransferase [Halosimplex sp. TS25]|uniref:phosphotransferase n=1 Tax=Halosimplex rarum TaxID=3396619 RepID=UPI0039E7F055